jgi:hypothetical protein
MLQLTESSFCAWYRAAEPRVTPTSAVNGFTKCLEHTFGHVMRFIAIEQLDVQVTPRFVREGLEKLACKAESECAGHVLPFFGCADSPKCELVEPAPYKVRATAKVNHTPCKALVHRHIRLGKQRVCGVEPGAEPPDAFPLAKCLRKSLAQRDSTVFDRMMRINRKVASAPQRKVNDGVLRKQTQHVIEERYAGVDFSLAGTVNVESDGYRSFFCFPDDYCPPGVHGVRLTRAGLKKQFLNACNWNGLAPLDLPLEPRFEMHEPESSGQLNPKHYLSGGSSFARAVMTASAIC